MCAELMKHERYRITWTATKSMGILSTMEKAVIMLKSEFSQGRAE